METVLKLTVMNAPLNLLQVHFLFKTHHYCYSFSNQPTAKLLHKLVYEFNLSVSLETLTCLKCTQPSNIVATLILNTVLH